MARGKCLERNKAASEAVDKKTAAYRAQAKADRGAVKQATADYKAKWATEKEARAADRMAVMTGGK